MIHFKPSTRPQHKSKLSLVPILLRSLSNDRWRREQTGCELFLNPWQQSTSAITAVLSEHTKKFPLFIRTKLSEGLSVRPLCGARHFWRLEWATGFWTLREKSTTGQPCVMQPREMMSTRGEKYIAKFSGVTPPLASISRVGNSSFSARAATWSSYRWETGLLFHVEVQWQSGWKPGDKNEKWPGMCSFNILYLRLKVIQHNDVCSCSGRLSALLCGAALHLNLTAEATHWPGTFHSLEDKQGCFFVLVERVVSTPEPLTDVRLSCQTLFRSITKAPATSLFVTFTETKKTYNPQDHANINNININTL